MADFKQNYFQRRTKDRGPRSNNRISSPEVQVIANDLAVAANTGRIESGQPLWKRLTYVAITRAQHRLHWVTRNRLSKPKMALDTIKLI